MKKRFGLVLAVVGIILTLIHMLMKTIDIAAIVSSGILFLLGAIIWFVNR